MKDEYDHKNQKVPQKDAKPSETGNGVVFFNKLTNVPKAQNNANLKSLDMLFKTSLTNDKKPNAAIFMVFGYSIENIHQLYTNGTKVIMLADPRINDYNALKAQENIDKNLKLLWVEKDSNIKNTAFHPKLYLLKFDLFLRVVIGSGNLFPEDWTVWSNIFWTKDFPFTLDSSTSKTCDFKLQLEAFAKLSMGAKYTELKKFLGIDLKDYDFSKAGVNLIYSIPIKKDISNIKESYGYEQLISLMKNNEPSKPYNFDNTKIYYSCSCIGGVNFGMVYQFITSIIPSLKSDKFVDFKAQQKYFNMLRLIYPTKSYINGLGVKNTNTGCLFFNKKTYHKINFNADILTQFENNETVYGDENIVSHSKVFIVLHGSKVDDDTVIYIGSHNFTKSAWGKISRGKYEIWNHELGVIFPAEKGSASLKRDIISKLSFKIPASDYDENDQPFFTVDN